MKQVCYEQEAKPEYIRKAFGKDDVYDSWLRRIDSIERFTIESKTPGDSLSIGYMLFPLIDSIALNLGMSFRRYLEKLGIERADILYKIFRNGHLHNAANYRLRYDNEDEVGWSMMSSGGSSGFHDYDPGYVDEVDPEDSMPAEEVFSYEQYQSGEVMAYLKVDRLAACVRHDLLLRKKKDNREEIDVVIGQRIPGKRPSARPAKVIDLG